MAIKKVKKSPAKTAPVAVASAPAACTCVGHRHGFWHFMKKLLIFAIVFALGIAVCKYTCCAKKFGKGKMHGKFGMEQKFVNGCLDLTHIKCPEMAEKIAMADVNGDGCITPEEFRAFKKKPCPKAEAMESEEM